MPKGPVYEEPFNQFSLTVTTNSTTDILMMLLMNEMERYSGDCWKIDNQEDHRINASLIITNFYGMLIDSVLDYWHHVWDTEVGWQMLESCGAKGLDALVGYYGKTVVNDKIKQYQNDYGSKLTLF